MSSRHQGISSMRLAASALAISRSAAEAETAAALRNILRLLFLFERHRYVSVGAEPHDAVLDISN